MTDELDVELDDPVLTAEILLVADLMVAGSESAAALSETAIDHLLTAPAAVSTPSEDVRVCPSRAGTPSRGERCARTARTRPLNGVPNHNLRRPPSDRECA